jgi:hypothetical protein
MPKNRKFIFTDKTAPAEEQVKEVEALGYRRAVKSYQSGSKAKFVEVEWTTKSGEEFYKLQKLPLGRSKKLGR